MALVSICRRTRRSIQWAVRFVQLRFVQWYNDEHRHSGIRYVTPGQRHAGQDRPLLEARHAVYQDARDRTPRRWSRQTRNWTPITTVTLNPQARYAGPGGDVTNPAFLFDRHICFPIPTWRRLAAARNAGDGRSGATPSHAQHCEHRTFPAVTTVASLASVGGPHSGISASLQVTSGNLFDTHRALRRPQYR
jgi:putative transposase